MEETELQIVDESIEAIRQEMVDLTYQAQAGEVSENEWAEGIVALMVAEYLRQWMLGRGSTELTTEEIETVTQAATSQASFIRNTGALLAGLSVQEVARRAAMYANSARQMYERGRAEQRYNIRLPAYPGDGSTECRSNCKCRWEIVEGSRNVLAYWRLGAADHCRTCVDRSGRWNPYIIEV